MDSRGRETRLHIGYNSGSIFGLTFPPVCAFALIKWLLQIVTNCSRTNAVLGLRVPVPAIPSDAVGRRSLTASQSSRSLSTPTKRRNRYWWKTL